MPNNLKISSNVSSINSGGLAGSSRFPKMKSKIPSSALFMIHLFNVAMAWRATTGFWCLVSAHIAKYNFLVLT